MEAYTFVTTAWARADVGRLRAEGEADADLVHALALAMHAIAQRATLRPITEVAAEIGAHLAPGAIVSDVGSVKGSLANGVNRFSRLLRLQVWAAPRSME